MYVISGYPTQSKGRQALIYNHSFYFDETVVQCVQAFTKLCQKLM
jgi:hypothetical protein